MDNEYFQNRILTDKNSSKSDQIWIRSKNIRTIYIQSCHLSWRVETTIPMHNTTFLFRRNSYNNQSLWACWGVVSTRVSTLHSLSLFFFLKRSPFSLLFLATWKNRIKSKLFPITIDKVRIILWIIVWFILSPNYTIWFKLPPNTI